MAQKINDLLEIVDRYDGLLFDAYGVLVDDSQMIPGAAQLWTSLQTQRIPCWIVTNGSARTLEETVASYAAKGLKVRPEQVINSASLLPAYYADEQLMGHATAVLGTPSSALYVKAAGGRVVDPLSEDFSVLVVANQTEYPLLESIDAVLSRILHRIEGAQACKLVLTNPDLIYPKNGNSFGITAGSIALLLEQALAARLGAKAAPRFDRLGKPHGRIFAEAMRRAQSKRLLMIGDQLETDIRGARDSGLDSLLVACGLTPKHLVFSAELDPDPTYILDTWRL